MLPIVFTRAARIEILDAHGWYAARGQILAQRFAAELDAVITRISEKPLQFRLIQGDGRRAMMRRFPYGVFFRILSDRVQIIACLHTSRDPRQWQNRM